MAKRVKWNGSYGQREIHEFIFAPGQVHLIEDDEVADDILTQPGENFEEIVQIELTATPAPEPGDNPVRDLTRIEGIGPKRAAALVEAGIVSLAALAALDGEGIAGLHEELDDSGITEFTIINWSQAAGELVAG